MNTVTRRKMIAASIGSVCGGSLLCQGEEKVATLPKRFDRWIVPVEWVPVYEGFPTCSDDIWSMYLLVTPGGSVVIGRIALVTNKRAKELDTQAGLRWEDNQGFLLHDITHWAKLPTVPSKVREEKERIKIETAEFLRETEGFVE